MISGWELTWMVGGGGRLGGLVAAVTVLRAAGGIAVGFEAPGEFASVAKCRAARPGPGLVRGGAFGGTGGGATASRRRAAGSRAGTSRPGRTRATPSAARRAA